MRKNVTPVLVVLLTIVFCAGIGCGKKISETLAEKALEKALAQDGTEAKVTIDSKTGSVSITAKDADGGAQISLGEGGISVKTQDGEAAGSFSADGGAFTMTGQDGTASFTVGEAAEVPEGFPQDVPIYPGAQIQMVSADHTNNNYSVSAVSSDPPEKVADFYKKEMADGGWNEVQGMTTTGDNAMHILNFEKDDATAVIIVIAQDGKTTLSIATDAN